MHARKLPIERTKLHRHSEAHRARDEWKKIKKIRIMKAPIGLHVVPSPSYPGLHTHFASGSSCWQDALGSQMSTSKQDISARRKKNRIVVLLLSIPSRSFYDSNFSSGKILWNAKASESSLVFRETRYYNFEFYEQFLQTERKELRDLEDFFYFSTVVKIYFTNVHVIIILNDKYYIARFKKRAF